MKNVIITILVIVVLGLGGYLVYDKVINKEDVIVKEEQTNEQDLSNDVTIEQKDAAYFDEYLKAFLSCEGLFISRNTENFSNKDITNFVSRYYNLLAYDDGLGTIVYKANVSDADALIYKYFNKKDVILETKPNEAVIITKQDNVYSFEWAAVGCGYNEYKNAVVTYSGENVTVKYNEYSNIEEKYTGKTLTFHLKYNSGNYNVIKIEG